MDQNFRFNSPIYKSRDKACRKQTNQFTLLFINISFDELLKLFSLQHWFIVYLISSISALEVEYLDE